MAHFPDWMDPEEVRIVLSLYDFTGEAVRPWAEAGYQCHIYDIKHPEVPERIDVGKRGGSITKHRADLHNPFTIDLLAGQWGEAGVVFLSAFPVCTDLAVSGARHFAQKEEEYPGFQLRAAGRAMWCADLAEHLGCPYYIENPVSRLSTLWRKPDYTFNPCDFGGYIPIGQHEHPRWPEVIPPRDAYTKRTCLWTGGGFVMPVPSFVDPVRVRYQKADGSWTVGSPQFGKLGGKSQRTKDIRSATPRGFARAVYLDNGMEGTTRADYDGLGDAINRKQEELGLEEATE